MSSPSTNEILARRWLEMPCGQEVVDWAASLLEQGRESRHLLLLAACSPPFSHFELARYRDLALAELSLERPPGNDPVVPFAAELLRDALAQGQDLYSALSLVKKLCIQDDYCHELYDFYLLWFAVQDLQVGEDQRYWEGATSKNIDRIIRDRAEKFVAEQLSTRHDA